MQRREGTIFRLTDRGFGFIARPGATDVFFHASDLVGLEFEKQLLERRVQFDEVQTERGPRARNVRAAED